jgi:hypothetical protein
MGSFEELSVMCKVILKGLTKDLVKGREVNVR